MIAVKTLLAMTRAVLTTGIMTPVKIATVTLIETQTVETMTAEITIAVLNWHSSIASLTVTAKPPSNFVAIHLW